MKKVLITGATGNVGIEIIKAIDKMQYPYHINAGVKDLESDKIKLANYNLGFEKFDFTDITTYTSALEGCNILFLLRPPQISDTKKYFKPLIDAAKEKRVEHIIFLSVQGVEKSTIIPHHKIEKLIVESGIPYTFLRPAYFMQNFSTTLRHDLVHKKIIFLPAGNAKFTLIDVRDIGEVTAKIIMDTPSHAYKSYELTNNEKWTFEEMAYKLSNGLGTQITYESPNLFKFFWVKRKEKTPVMFILVMIMLHYLPKFQKEPQNTMWVKNIIGREPLTFDHFIEDNKNLLM
jgi:uncharacterized protein YbjT (DUF2867 family)